MPLYILKIIYNSLYVSNINYCITAWGVNLSHGHRLINLQKKVIRCIAQSKYNSHTSPILFKNLGVLKMVDVYKMACLKLFYKFKHDNVPDYFLQMFFTRDSLTPRRIVRVPQRLITHDIIVQNDLFRIEVTHTNIMCSSLCIRHVIPKLLQETYLPIMVLDKINTLFSWICELCKSVFDQ